MNTNLQTTTNKLVLDFHQRNGQTVLAKEYDKGSRFIPIQCMEHGEPFALDSSIEIQVKVLTPDNRALLEHSAVIQNDGSILLELTENMLYYPGKANVELIFYDFEHKKRLSPMKFDLLIDSSTYPDDRIISSDEFNALTDLIEKVTTDYTYVIKEAESWAHGNTGIREGENTDNSKYWSEQSKEYSIDIKNSLNKYVQKSGDIMTGDLGITNQKSTIDGSVPYCGNLSPHAPIQINLEDLQNYKTFLGSYLDVDNARYSIISVRAQNGFGNDNHGMYFRTKTNINGNLYWGKQIGDNHWQAERTLLDTINYSDIINVFQNKIHLTQGAYIHTVNDNESAIAGYMCIASITMNSDEFLTPDDLIPLQITILSNRYKESLILTMVFNKETHDVKIYYNGNSFKSTNNTIAALVRHEKEGNISKWRLYVYISKDTDTLFITDFKSLYNDNQIHVEWLDTGSVLENLPTANIYKAENNHIDADTFNGYHTYDFVPISSKTTINMNYLKGLGISTSSNIEELKIRNNRVDLLKYYDENGTGKSIGVFSTNKVEINNENSITLKAPNLILTAGKDRILEANSNGVHLKQTNKIYPLTIHNTSAIASANNEMFIINSTEQYNNSSQKPSCNMMCGVTGTAAYLGEVHDFEQIINGSMASSNFRCGIHVNSYQSETHIYSDKVNIGKEKRNYFIESNTYYASNNRNDYSYNVKLRNNKGVFIEVQSPQNGTINAKNNIILNGAIYLTNENNVLGKDEYYSYSSDILNDIITQRTLQDILGELITNSQDCIHFKQLTQEQYNVLSDMEKMNGTLYFITNTD